VKFPPFDYVRVGTVAEAVDCLSDDEDAKVLAGGQSLLPLMALRLARPSVLIDIASLDLAGVELDQGVLTLGGLVRHSALLDDPAVQTHAPLLTAAAAHVGHPAIRHRGTLAGSLAHADPAAELAAAAVALDATVTVQGPDGLRSLTAADLIDGYFTNNLQMGEVIVAIVVPAAATGQGTAFCEWAPRVGDFAEVGVGMAVDPGEDGACASVRAATCGVGSAPLSIGRRLETLLIGTTDPSPAQLADAARIGSQAAVEAGADEDKTQLTGLLTARAVWRAFVGMSR
jgi:carbon-monoxide dehydrogenase medium subunit